MGCLTLTKSSQTK